MTDITARLRRLYIDTGSNYVQEAADRIETLRQRVKGLINEHAALQDGVISRDMTIDGLRQRVSELEDALESAYVVGEVNGELAALKQEQGEPVATAHVGNGSFIVTVRWNQLQEIGFNLDTEREVPLYTSAPTIPEGYVLVPVEATYEMREAVRLATESEGLTTTAWQRNAICAAMLTAAPKPKEMSERERLMLTGDEPRVVAETQGATVWARKWGAKDWWPIVNVELDCGRITIDVCGLGEVWDLGECAQLRMGNDEFVESDDIYTVLASCVGCWRIDKARQTK